MIVPAKTTKPSPSIRRAKIFAAASVEKVCVSRGVREFRDRPRLRSMVTNQVGAKANARIIDGQMVPVSQPIPAANSVLLQSEQRRKKLPRSRYLRQGLSAIDQKPKSGPATRLVRSNLKADLSAFATEV